MNFKEAYKKMEQGYKIKRPHWKGYWCLENGIMNIHLANGELLVDEFNTETISNCAKSDWEVIDEEKKK